MGTHYFMIPNVQKYIQQWYVVEIKNSSLNTADSGEGMIQQQEVYFFMKWVYNKFLQLNVHFWVI